LSRQLALGGEPVLVARWTEGLGLVEEHRSVNRLLLVDARPDTPELGPLVQAAVAHGCALVVCLGHEAEHVQRVVDKATEALGQVVATSWHDSQEGSEAALDAFSLFTSWVGGAPGIRVLVTEDAGLDTVLDAARRLHGRSAPRTR
jgi:hypothetical protein